MSTNNDEMRVVLMKNEQNTIVKNFWQELPDPFFVLAPMADVTDAAFRRVIAKYSRMGQKNGGPDVMWTEFVSADGLCHPEGREKLMHNFWFTQEERPIVAQIFGATPKNFQKAAALCRQRGFDGIDINMGCPEKNIQKQGACAALIKEPSLAQDIVHAAKEGAKDIPVSVKSRIGYTKVEIDTWIPALLQTKPAALSVHLRTKKEMSDVPAHWELMPQIVEMAKDTETVIIGNGDVKDLEDAKKKVADSGCDGVMLGRAIFGNPWLFDEESNGGKDVPNQKRLEVMIEHTKLYLEIFSGIKNFAVMKKHYKAYASGFPGAKTLRTDVMNAKSASEMSKIVEEFLAKNVEVLENTGTYSFFEQ